MKLMKSLCEKLSHCSSSNNNNNIGCEEESSPPITSIYLVSCSDADAYIDSFTQLLQQSHIQQIFVRTDYLKRMTPENALLFLKSLDKVPLLEELIIQSSSRFHVEVLPTDGLLSIRQATRLKRFVLEDIQATTFHSTFLMQLASALQNHPTLCEIKMTNFFANDGTNYYYNNTTTTTTTTQSKSNNILDPLILSLSTIPNLKCLDLSGCVSHALTGLNGQDMRMKMQLVSPQAVSTLLDCPLLKCLHLGFLQFTDDHFQAMAGKLYKNTSLEVLLLDYHHLGNNGFQYMMQGMEGNSSIQSLSLRSLQEIGPNGFDQAMSMLQVNYCIQNFNVTATPIQQAQMDLYLRMNRAGRALLRREPTSTSMYEWIDILVKHSDDLDVIRHLLQEIPGLCHAATIMASERRQRQRQSEEENPAACRSTIASSSTPAA